MDTQRPLRSCIVCRQRKVKCDRQQPCANCLRSESQCVYPAGVGRAPKRPRKAVEARLLAQLSRLENAVKRMEGQSLETSSSTAVEGETDERNPEVEKQFGRLVIDNNQSCYVSSAPWTQLGDEIEELRDLLHQPASDDEEEQSVSAPEGLSPGPGMNGAIMGFRALAHSLHQYHPPLSQAVTLFDVFRANVAPLVRVFHMPTLDRLFWDAVASMDSIEKNMEALLFSIYYSALISLDSEQCFSTLGVSRPSALQTYRFAVEQAMARANLLNTQNLLLLQATVLFLTAVRNEDDSRTVWSLTALVYHIAQAMGLHRDGETFGLRPLETELRRRLWWHICLLDNRSTDYHGSEPIVHESMFDTRIPLNINDSDITAEMTQPPPEREGTTEMTLSLIRCTAMQVVWKVGYMAPRKNYSSETDQRESASRIALAEDLERRLHDQFLKYCDPSIPLLRLASTVAQIITRRMWMGILSPLARKDKTIRDRLFRDSIQVLELSTALLTEEDVRRWAWHSRTHIQWYSVAFLLAELCWRPPSTECDRAWECVTAVYDRWVAMDLDKKGTLWRPIRRLMARARYVREIRHSTMHPAGVVHQWRSAGGLQSQSKSHSQSTENTSPGSVGFNAPPGLTSKTLPGSGGEMASTPSDDPLMEMLPSRNDGIFDPSAMGLFGLLSETSGFPWEPGYIPNINGLPDPVQSP